MKRQAYNLMALLVLVGSMAVAAQAQTSGRTQLIANIPFQFNVGEKTMPAGEYTVIQVNPSSDQAVLQIRTKDGSRTVMIQTSNVTGKASESARLVFNRYGSQYFFSQAWTSSDAGGLQVPKSKAERWARQELAGLKQTPETVSLKVR
jgi:hypothetical protein